MLKFLHLADVHLDAVIPARTPELRARLREAQRTAFARAIDCALAEQVQAVLIAGDLYDDERLSYATEQFMLEQLGRLADAQIPCIYVTGDHDPGGRRFRAAGIPWPSTVDAIAERELTCIALTTPEGDALAYVIGLGHEAAREHENLAALFPEAEPDVPHIGLLHATVDAADGTDAHEWIAPCTQDDLSRTGYCYWALGHVHTRQQVGDGPVWYPGSLQGCTPQESGARGGLLVTLPTDGPPEVTFRPFAPLQWGTLHLDDLAITPNVNELEQRIRYAFEGVRREQRSTADWVVQVHLHGPCPLAETLHDAELRTELEESLAKSLDVVDVELVLHDVVHPVDVDRHRGQAHVLSEVLELIEVCRAQPAVLDELVPEPLARSGEKDRSAYLNELLHDLDRDVAARMLDEH